MRSVTFLNNCSVADCPKRVQARDLCQMHYMRLRRHGELQAHVNDYLRFFNRVNTSEDGCWEWDGSRNWGGYGLFWLMGKTVSAHRLAYEWMVGPIPSGMTIDHLCSTRHCQRPDHLEPVSIQENLRRRKGSRWAA